MKSSTGSSHVPGTRGTSITDRAQRRPTSTKRSYDGYGQMNTPRATSRRATHCHTWASPLPL